MTESGDGRSVSLLKRGVSMAAEVTLCPLVGDKVICGEKNEGRNNKHTHIHTYTHTHTNTQTHNKQHTQNTNAHTPLPTTTPNTTHTQMHTAQIRTKQQTCLPLSQINSNCLLQLFLGAFV